MGGNIRRRAVNELLYIGQQRRNVLAWRWYEDCVAGPCTTDPVLRPALKVLPSVSAPSSRRRWLLHNSRIADGSPGARKCSWV